MDDSFLLLLDLAVVPLEAALAFVGLVAGIFVDVSAASAAIAIAIGRAELGATGDKAHLVGSSEPRHTPWACE